MKGTDQFVETIQQYLHKAAQEDPLIAEGLKKPGKNIDGCIAYILKTVQASNKQGFTDDEVYGMALHYYDEDDIKNEKIPNCKVVVNHIVELSDKEKEELKEKAKAELINEAKAKMLSKKKSSPKPDTKTETQQSTLF